MSFLIEPNGTLWRFWEQFSWFIIVPLLLDVQLHFWFVTEICWLCFSPCFAALQYFLKLLFNGYKLQAAQAASCKLDEITLITSEEDYGVSSMSTDWSILQNKSFFRTERWNKRMLTKWLQKSVWWADCTNRIIVKLKAGYILKIHAGFLELWRWMWIIFDRKTILAKQADFDRQIPELFFSKCVLEIRLHPPEGKWCWCTRLCAEVKAAAFDCSGEERLCVWSLVSVLLPWLLQSC